MTKKTEGENTICEMDWMAALPVISTVGLTKLEIDGDVRVSTVYIWNSRYGSTQLIKPLTKVQINYIDMASGQTIINGHARLFFSRNKFHPTHWFSCNRMKIPSYPSVPRVGWIFHPSRLFKPTHLLLHLSSDMRQFLPNTESDLM